MAMVLLSNARSFHVGPELTQADISSHRDNPEEQSLQLLDCELFSVELDVRTTGFRAPTAHYSWWELSLTLATV
jgi:hypothetical protein